MNEIKDGIYAHIGGTVVDVFHAKTGMAVVLEVKNEMRQYPDKVTVWGVENTIVSKNDRLKVKGWLSWTKDVKGDKTYFNVSLNKVEILAHYRLAAPTVTSSESEPF
jgi:putative heme iron utilization protein